MKHLLIALLLCCLARTASGQPCPQAAKIRSDLQSAYDTGLLDKAFESIKALRACDASFGQEADRWADQIFAVLKNQKSRAEEAERRAQVETTKALSELKQSTSIFWHSEARNNFEKSYTQKALAALLKSREAWDGNAEAQAMLDSIGDFCPDWAAVTSRYVRSDAKPSVLGYFEETTKSGGLCDYIVWNIDTGDTMMFRQVSLCNAPSMAASFSRDGKKAVYYTALDSSGKTTINIYDSIKKKTFRFPDCEISDNWFSENGRTFVFLTHTLGDKGYKQVCAFDFETETSHVLGKSLGVYADWRFWISPDGENVAYCAEEDSPMGDFGKVCLYNLKNKTSSNFDHVYLHGPEFSTDSRYMAIQYTTEDIGGGATIDLKTGAAQEAILNTTWIQGYSGPVTIRRLNFGPRRKISTYDPVQKKWLDTPMSEQVQEAHSDLLFVDDMMLYTFYDSITGREGVGADNFAKNQGIAFKDDYLASIPLFRLAQNLNKAKNICFLVDAYNGIVRSYDFEAGRKRDFADMALPENKLRGQKLGFTSDGGDWSWVLKNRHENVYGFDLMLVSRRGNDSVIDSGYFNITFFAIVGEQTKLIYVQNVNKGAESHHDIVIYDPTTESKTRLKAHNSNQILANKYDFTDLWLDEDRRLLVYSPSPKTFSVWDLASNKSIRTFKIEQEYVQMELRGKSGLIEIAFNNGVKKWVKIDAPAQPLQWHINSLSKQK
ncbi:MAG: hypothetical protein H7246_22900 [Phycisphaerae bacterium]|nr:hypothetical protein [Saprospiraceae bacterium]